STSATLSWTVPDWSGGDHINGYRIEQSTDGTNWTTVTANTGWRTTTTHTVNGLIPGTRHWFRVAAVGFTGIVGEYASTSVTSLVSADPPSNLSLARVDNSSAVRATWSAPAFTGGSAIVGYRVERFLSSTWFVVTPNTGNTETSFVLDGNDAGSTLQIRVSAVTAAGNGESATAAIVVGGANPGGVRFSTVVGNGFVDLAWAASTAFAPSSYRLEYRVVGSTSWTVATSDSGPVTSYRLAGLSNGVNYEVRLTPVYVVGGASSFGTPSSVFFEPVGLPSAPTGLNATTGNASSTLSWSAPADTGGGSVIGYRIEQSTTSSTTGYSVLTPNTGSAGTTFTVNGLQNGTQHWFRVSALTDVSAGSSGSTTVVSVTPVLPGRAVAWLSAAPGNTTAVLTWERPQFDDEATDYIGYRIERSTDGTSFTTIASNVGKVLTYTATGLTNGTTYWFRVVTLGQLSDGGSSTISVVPARYSSRLPSLTATINDRLVTLNWTRPTDTGGWPLLGYMISRCWSGGIYCDPTNSNYWTSYLSNAYRAANDQFSTIAFVGPDATSFTFNVNDAEAYRVIPVTALGIWSGAAGGSATWFPNASAIQATWWGLPSSVNGLKATVNSPGGLGAANTMIYFDWTAPTNLGNGAISGYDVEQSLDGGATWISLGRTRNTFQYISGIPSGVSVMLRVRAANEYGVGAWSSVTSSWTATPTTPRNPSITSVGNRVTVTWEAPEVTSGMGVLGYAIEYNLGSAWQTWPGSGVGFTATSLQWSAPANTYYPNLQWRVRALITAPSTNGSLTSEWAYVGTPLLATASAVASPRAVAASTTVALTWGAPTDLGGGTITGYRVEQNFVGSLWFPVGVTTTTSMDVRGLVNGNTYRFRITPVTTQGDGTPSVLSAMPFGPSAAPSLVRAISGDGFVTVSWSAPSSSGGLPVTGYQLDLCTYSSCTWTTYVRNSGAPSSTSYTFSGLTNGTQYQARVSAVTGACDETLADTSASSCSIHGAMVLATPASVPSAPQSLTASVATTANYGVPTASGQVTLNWAAPVSNGGQTIYGYMLEQSDNDGATWTTISPNLGSSSVGVPLLSTVVTGLVPGSVYAFRVTPLTAEGSGASSITSIVAPAWPTTTTVPNMIGGATVTTTASAVTVTWRTPSTPLPTGYKVEIAPASTGVYTSAWGTWSGQSTTANMSATATSVGGSVTSVTITNQGSATGVLTAGASYLVRITPANGSGAATATVVNATPMSVPTEVRTTSAVRGDGRVTLTWAAPTSNGGYSIISYRMEYSIDGTNWTTLTLDASGTTYAVRGLTNGTPYTFRMAAITSAGQGAWGTFGSVTPATVPLSPLGVSVQGGDRRATVSWSLPANDGGNAITGYKVFRNGVLLTTVAANTFTFTDTNGTTGLVNGTSYFWEVRAVNAIGDSTSSPVYATPFAQVAAPTNVLAVRGNRQATLSWTAPTNTSGFTLTGYQIERSVNGTSWTIDSYTSATSSTITNLTNGVLYYFRVTAYVNGGPAASPGGLGVVSAAASTTPMTAATAPTAFSAVRGNGSVALSWQSPQDPGGAPVTAYQISQCTASTTVACSSTAQYTTIVPSTNSTGTTHTVSGLTNGTNYFYTVAAITNFGVGTSTNVYATNATPGGTASAPTLLDAVPGDGRATVTWSAPADNGGYTLTGYKVERSSDNGVNWSLLVNSVNTTNWVDTSLVNGVKYTYRVSAQNALGYGVDSTTDVIPFGVALAPAALSATAGSTQATLDWSAPTSNGGSAVTGYRVEQSTNNSTWTTLAPNTGLVTSYNVSGLTNGTSYYFRVTALTSNANNVGAVTTALPLSTASAPTSFGSTVDAAGGVTLTWAAPANNGGSPVTNYVVQRSTDGTNWVEVARPSGLTVNVTGLALGTNYNFRVAATTSVGVGAFSSTTATPLTAPRAPRDLVATIDGSGVATLSWLAPTSDGGSPVIGYTIERCNAGQSACSSTTVSTTTCPSATAFCLLAGAYSGGLSITVSPTSGVVSSTFAVTAITAVNSTTAIADARAASGSLVTVSVPQAAVASTASAPTNFGATAGNASVILRWAVPSSLGSPAPASYTYTVQRSTDGSTWTTLSSTITSATLTYTDSTALNGTTYTYRIAANTNTAGLGTYATVTARPLTTSSAVATISAVAADASVTVNWTAPSVTGGASVTNYIVDVCTSSAAACIATATTGFTTVSTTVPATSTSLVVTGLTNGTVHYFRVRPQTVAGVGTGSVTAQTPGGAPGVPVAFSATAANTGSVTLGWTAPSVTGGSTITGYRVEVCNANCASGGTYTVLGTTTATTPFVTGATSGFTCTSITACVVAAGTTGLVNGTLTTFRVSAVNANGTGSGAVAIGVPYTLASAPTGNNPVVSANPSNVDNYGTTVTTDGPTLWFRFNNAASTTPTDASGATRAVAVGASGVTFGGSSPFGGTSGSAMFAGTAANAAAYPTTAPTSPVSFQGTVSTLSTADMRLGGSFTLEAWVRPSTTSVNRWQTIISRGNFANGTRNFGLFQQGSQVMFSAQGAGSTHWLLATQTGVLTANVWAHIVGVFNQTTGTMELFVNGTRQSSTVVTTSGGAVPTGVGELVIGNGYSADGSFFTGSLSEVAVYDKALSSARISAHYSASGIPVRGLTAPSVVTAGNNLNLSWTAPSDTGGFAITGYKIEYLVPSTSIATFTGATWSTLIADTGSSATTYTLNSAVTSALGQGYSFRVTALTTMGEGTPSLPAGPYGTSAAPSSPTSFTVTGGTERVTLGWAAPVSSGGLSVTGYRLERSADNGTTWTTLGTTTSTTPFVSGAVAGVTCSAITSCVDNTSAMTPGASFVYRVVAISPAGSSDPSTASGGPANTVTSLMAVVGNTQVGLTWDQMPMTAGQAVSGYLVDRCTGTCTASSGTYTAMTAVTGAPTSTTTGVSAPYYTATGLVNGTTYTFRVRAVYGASNTTGPAVIVAGTPVASAQVAVQLLNSTASSTSVSLNWLAPVRTSGDTVIGYRVEYCSINCGLSTATFTPATATAGAPTGATTTLLTHVVTGLTTGTTYAFRVTPVLSNTSTGIPSPAVIFDTPTQTVGAPTAMAAAGRLNSVNVTWTPPATTGGYPVLGYRVEYRQGGSGDFTTATSNTYSSTPSFTVLNLVAGQLYGFRVTALTAAGPGATSDVVTGTPYGAASAPSNLVAAASSGQAQLSWVAPSSTGGNPITGYRIEQTVDGGTTWTDAVANTGTTATTYSLNGLDNGVTILLRVSAVTSAGSGATSNIATAIPSSPSAAPVNLTGLAANAQAVLTWLPPADTGGLPVIGYLVERSLDSSTWSVATANTGSAVPASVQSGLLNGTTYYFRVSAITAGGTGAATAPIAVTPFTTPSAPTNLTPAPGDGQVALSWNAPVSNGGVAITDYKVDQSFDGGITWSSAVSTTGGLRTATVTGLTNGAPILFRVFAVNAAGVGTPTAAISTSAYTLPDAPTSLSATGANTSALLSWVAPLNTNGSPVSGYRVERSTDGGATWIVALANTGNSGTNVVVNGLVNGTSYSFRVSAINAAGAGAVSNEAAATPLTTPSAPTAVVAVAGDGVVSLSWNLPVSDGGSAVVDYLVDRSTDGGVSWTSLVSGVTTTSHVDSSLSNGTTYLYRVRAVNLAGQGSSSAGVVAVPSAKASAPTLPLATSGSGSVILTWTAPSSTGGTPIIGYQVDVSEDEGITWRTAITDTRTSSTYASVDDLAGGQPYTFRIAAINAAGVGELSSTVSGTPLVVSSVLLSGTSGNGQVNLTWTAPTDVIQTGYIVERSTDGTTWTSAMTNPSATAVGGASTGLTNGTLYIFRVQVVTAGGSASSYSNYVSFVPRGPAGAPTGLAGSGGDSQVTLRWTAPANNGGAAVTGY
ncbi:MAG: hypothetical protein F2562_02750, partial [Actinobacteria bacterium]|nr:hypothetical protein [Actinomycetota bacterium]